MNLRVIYYRPPRIAQLFILIAALLHWATPLSNLHIYSNREIGVVVGIAGFGLMMWCWWLFQKFNTAVNTVEKTQYLVTSGVYSLSRNPMYLGMIAMLFAIAIFVGSIPFYLAAVAYFLVINNVFCPYEENKLAGTFGDRYISYKNRVRRWI